MWQCDNMAIKKNPGHRLKLLWLLGKTYFAEIRFDNILMYLLDIKLFQFLALITGFSEQLDDIFRLYLV
jgi:hypothetical protein